MHATESILALPAPLAWPSPPQVLSAKVEDANTHFLCTQLRSIGWSVEKASRERQLLLPATPRPPPGRQLLLLPACWPRRGGSVSCPSSTEYLKLHCAALRCVGVQVVIVRDDVDAICREIRSLSAAHDVVLTAGGLGALVRFSSLSLALPVPACVCPHNPVPPRRRRQRESSCQPASAAVAAAAAGPTLDDVTMAGLAEAFGQKLALHPQLEARIRAYFGGGGTLTQAHLKMAEAPTGATCAGGCMCGGIDSMLVA